MLVPKLDKTINNEIKSNEEHIVIKVNEDRYVDFRELYMDIMEDDEKALDDYIKYIEKLVRSSYEYRQYIGILKTEFDLTKCAFFKNLDIKDTKRVSFEMHHYPFTLYDICLIIVMRRMEDLREDPTNQAKYNELLNPFSISKEVLKLHYEGKIGLVPLSLTPHELYHKGNLFIPLDKEYVFGNYDDFITEYGVEEIGNYKEILNLIHEKTNDILEGDSKLDLSKLQIKKVYLQMNNTNFIKKIEGEKNEEE